MHTQQVNNLCEIQFCNKSTSYSYFGLCAWNACFPVENYFEMYSNTWQYRVSFIITDSLFQPYCGYTCLYNTKSCTWFLSPKCQTVAVSTSMREEQIQSEHVLITSANTEGPLNKHIAIHTTTHISHDSVIIGEVVRIFTLSLRWLSPILKTGFESHWRMTFSIIYHWHSLELAIGDLLQILRPSFQPGGSWSCSLVAQRP